MKHSLMLAVGVILLWSTGSAGASKPKEQAFTGTR